MKTGNLLFYIVLVLGLTGSVSAQDFYDDDIYYDASKEEKKSIRKENSKNSGYESQTVFDYPAADNYTVVGTSMRDVDEYNRRYAVADTLASDSMIVDDFTYTRRIERFYNPSIVSSSEDEQLQSYYYSSTQEQPAEINIYVNNPYWSYWYPSSWYMGWSSPWYYNSWYGPSWYYSPDWFWCGHWGPAFYPGYYTPPHYHGSIKHRPASPGAYRPARPGYGKYESGRRPGNRNDGVSNYRPGGTNRNNSSISNDRRASNNRNSGVSSSDRQNSGVKNSGYSRRSNDSGNRNNSFSRPSGSSRGSGFSGRGHSGGSRGGRGGRH